MASLPYLRQAAQYLLDYAVCAERGRSEDDAVYKQITEYRDGPSRERRAAYSSCADLGHWLLFRLGCREPWINRKENHGWHDQINLNCLCPRPIGPCEAAVNGLVGEPLPGDILVIKNAWGGHVMCVRDRPNGRLATSEYGQPGGLAKVRDLTPAFKKTVMSWISLEKVPFTKPPDIMCLENWLTGEELDALDDLK